MAYQGSTILFQTENVSLLSSHTPLSLTSYSNSNNTSNNNNKTWQASKGPRLHNLITTDPNASWSYSALSKPSSAILPALQLSLYKLINFKVHIPHL